MDTIKKITVKAPAVVKLFGEHAVVYGKLSVAVALSLYAETTIEKSENNRFEVRLIDLNKHAEFSDSELEKIFDDYIKKESFDAFIKNQNVDKEILPYAVIAGRIRKLRNLSMQNTKASIKSEIPIQKGLASSAACSTSFTVALLNYYNISLSNNDIIDIARDGDKVIHKSEGAGKIDVSTSYYGGYVSYSAEKGAQKENISTAVDLLLIDTGPKKSTAETVGHVAELYKNDRENTEKILDEIEKCSRDGLGSLKEGNLKMFGELMYKNHELLSKLGVSSDSLENVLKLVKKNNGLGAKLSGGGGGGLAIALINNAEYEKEFIDDSKAYNFKVFKASMSNDGAKKLVYTSIGNNEAKK